jgi:hypothetical protein
LPPDNANLIDPRYDTYNRLRFLESKKPGGLFLAIVLFLFFANLALLVQVSQGWQDWNFLLYCGLASIGMILLIWYVYQNRRIRCRNCGTELEWVPRPLVLSFDYLSRKGLIINGTFYALRYQWPLRKVWAKLTRWTQACHQCKLLEESHTLNYIPLQPEEIEMVKHAISGEENA